MSSDLDFDTLPPSPKHKNKKNNTDELLQAVSVHKMKKMKRLENGKVKSDPMEIYRNAGRKVSCVLDLFALPSVAFHSGLQHDRGGKINDDLTEEMKRRHLHLYEGILNIIPSLRDELDTISSDKLSKIISAITKGMSDARSMAFSSIKHKGLKYVPLNMHSKVDALDPPIPEVEDKSIGMEKLQSGKLKMTAMNWPTGFYEDGVYDSQDKTKGMFRNHVVARFYTHLYIGPSAAMAESTTSKASKMARNRVFGLTSVTKNIIAIVHIITYFTLSHAQTWTNEIGTMNLEELFWAIIDMLDDDEDPWVQDTILWWNARVGSGVHQAKFIKKPSDSDDDSDQENDIAEIKAQSKRPAAAALFDNHEPQCPPVEKTSTAPLPRPVKPKPRPRPQPAAQLEESSDEDPVPVVPPSTCPASKKIRTEHHRLPESDEDLEYRALSPSTPPAKKTQPHSQTAKRPRPALVEDDEEPAQLSSPPPAKKIQSDSPLPPLTEDEDDEPSPPPPPKPTKQAKKVAPRPVVPSSPQPAATKLSLKIKLTPANPPSIEDEDITPDAPVASKKKGKKTSPTEATKRNPPRHKKRTNGF
ncbi:uncharacterized protein F5891DRAFT_1194925 [Suillus fuscotomentosus]|uniref:Uncharacterized protein n=1 Tax=Suillus fuscotomentosus TaxID=1912939 RepID=A0AAD4DVL2_9AGAM|nr:uncharacterized protein F5891DRAFT_1194925 [Suillus fuscotomentosus]KAG1894772.1 hypothetical protein F5891DRAFT_1194925 [Suillus fuscotomentosus]